MMQKLTEKEKAAFNKIILHMAKKTLTRIPQSKRKMDAGKMKKEIKAWK